MAPTQEISTSRIHSVAAFERVSQAAGRMVWAPQLGNHTLGRPVLLDRQLVGRDHVGQGAARRLWGESGCCHDEERPWLGLAKEVMSFGFSAAMAFCWQFLVAGRFPQVFCRQLFCGFLAGRFWCCW